MFKINKYIKILIPSPMVGKIIEVVIENLGF